MAREKKSRVEHKWRTSVAAPLQLLLSREEYYSRGYLNSDGMRLFESIARIILEYKPYYKPLISRVRKNPSLENIRKLASRVMEEDPLQSLG